ncbi:MAG: M42 family metallopeptidase [Thermoplasmata archaeon]
MELIDTLRDLVIAPGVSGYEAPIREYIKSVLKKYGEPKEDEVGNLYFSIGEGEELAFVAHMDEIGMVVSYIEEDGYLRMRKLGGVDSRYHYGKAVEIFTDTGVVNGVIGLKPVHLSAEEDLKKVIPTEELLIDVGAGNREEVAKLGIKTLDAVRWKKEFLILNDKYVASRGLDNRTGCAVLLMLIDRLASKKLGKKLTFIFTVQEETGLRGAKTFYKEHFKEVYAIDTVSAGDIANMQFHLSPVRTGKGAAIRFVDSRGVSSQTLRKKIKMVSEKENIPVQELYALGSTDAAATFELGLNSIALCIPVKYTHSPVEMVHIADLKNIILLLEKIIDY